MTCFLCQGSLRKRLRTFVVPWDDRRIVITDVPAWECEACKDAYYEEDTVRRIETFALSCDRDGIIPFRDIPHPFR
jgi:YgiT-type zinc finger domain-containing protein